MKGAGRRAEVFLSPSKKYGIYVQLMLGETTVGAAAARAGVDRSTIMWLRQVARQGALEALAASRPGVSGEPARYVELDQVRAGIDRLTRTVTEQAAGLVVLEEKGGGPGLMPAKPVPAGVGAAAKQGLLELVDYAAGQGWPASKTCEVLGLSERRHRRFRRRQDSGKKLDDGRPGASPGALMPCETCGGSWVPSRPSPTRTSPTGAWLTAAPTGGLLVGLGLHGPPDTPETGHERSMKSELLAWGTSHRFKGRITHFPKKRHTRRIVETLTFIAIFICSIKIHYVNSKG